MKRGAVALCLLLLCLTTVEPIRGQDQVEFVNSPPLFLTDTTLAALVRRWLTTGNGVLPDADVDKLDALLAKTLDTSRTTPIRGHEEAYCIIHLVTWSGEAVSQQLWLLYRGNPKHRWGSAHIAGQRLFGASTVGLLYVHVGAPQGSPTYKVSVTKKSSTPLRDLSYLVQFVLPAGGGKLLANPPDTTPRVTWGGRVLTVKFSSSDIAIDASIPSAGDAPQSFAKQTFDNEGKTWWDVSLGLPIHTVSELSYSSESGVVTARTVQREKAYALVDVFFPFRVDPRGTGFQYVPFVLGVSLADKPFDHLVVATGFGTRVVRVFYGAALNNDHKPHTLQPGTLATPSNLSNDQGTHYTAKFVFGLNISPTRLLAETKGGTSSQK